MEFSPELSNFPLNFMVISLDVFINRYVVRWRKIHTVENPDKDNPVGAQ